jgi:hypothetical protein
MTEFKHKARVKTRTLGVDSNDVSLFGKVDRGWSDIGRPKVMHNNEELVPVHLDGASYVSWHLPDGLELVEPEMSESERLPNGTVLRDKKIATNVVVKEDGMWLTTTGSTFKTIPWIDSGDYEILTPEKPEPRTFAAGDPEPGPEVTHVRDKDGDVFWRENGGWRWKCGYGYTWDGMNSAEGGLAPLTDVSAEYAE